MERPLLNDEREYPDDEVLAKYLGKAKPAWDAFAAGIARSPGTPPSNGGTTTMARLALQARTKEEDHVLGSRSGTSSSRRPFTSPARNDKDIEALPIPADLKDSVPARNAAIGKLKPLTVEIRTKKALEARLRAREVQEQPEVKRRGSRIAPFLCLSAGQLDRPVGLAIIGRWRT